MSGWDNYASYYDAYPLISYGSVGEICMVDNQCAPGLVCKMDERWGGSTCRPPIPIDMSYGCQRSRDDGRCHKYIGSQKIMCDENACADMNKYMKSVSGERGFGEAGSATPGKDPCRGAFRYDHEPTNTHICARINELNQIVPLSDSCCTDFAGWDAEAEWKKYSLSPQAYGVRR